MSKNANAATSILQVGDSIVLRSADVGALADAIGRVVADRLAESTHLQYRHIVDLPTMAHIANIGSRALARLVDSNSVPSVMLDELLFFEPEVVMPLLEKLRGRPA